MNCQSNDAAYVKINTPRLAKSDRLGYWAVSDTMLMKSGSEFHPFKKVLAICLRMGVFIFTYEIRFHRAPACPRQDPGASPERYTQPPRPESAGPVVFGGGLLRPAGPPAGQIRNAPPRSERSDADWRRRSEFRVFSSLVLQGPGGLCPRRASGVDSQKTWPQGKSQVNWRDYGVRGPKPRPRTAPQNLRLGSADSKTVWDTGAPKDLGASFDRREKKTAPALVGEAGQSGLPPAATLTEHYEQLRESVLARKRSSGLQGGQAALTARGMVTWIQLARQPIPPLRCTFSPASTEVIQVPPPVQDDLIQLMGEVVMTLVRRDSTL